MYNRSKRSKAVAFGTWLKTGLALLAVALLGVFGFKWFTGGQTAKTASAVAQSSASKPSVSSSESSAVKTASSSSGKVSQSSSTKKTSVSSSSAGEAATTEIAGAEVSTDQETTTQAEISQVATTQANSESSVEGQVVAEVSVEQAGVYAEQAVTYETVAYSAESSYDSVANYGYQDQTYYNSAYTYTPDYSSGVILANGNTAGAIGSDAAAQMAAATGVPQSTWEYIIARESNGDPYAANASGASGLFQTMPGWGSTATVQDQINAAINAYNAQGLAAWGY